MDCVWFDAFQLLYSRSPPLSIAPSGLSIRLCCSLLLMGVPQLHAVEVPPHSLAVY